MPSILKVFPLALVLPFVLSAADSGGGTVASGGGATNAVGFGDSIGRVRGFPASGTPLAAVAPISSAAKFAAGYQGGPQFILWSHVPHINSSAWANKRIVMRARCDPSSQYWYTGGTVGAPGFGAIPAPYNTDAFMVGDYNTLDPATDLQDITGPEKAARNTAICRWVARTFADRQYYQGLFRGKGYAKNGLAGGCLDVPWGPGWAHFGDGTGATIARKKIASMLFDPRDAVAKSATVLTPTGNRTITLPNRQLSGGVPGAFYANPQTPANVANLEALDFAGQVANSVRHTGNHTVFMAYGIADIVALNTELAYWIRQEIDAYVPYAGGGPYELCEPAICLVDEEYVSARCHQPAAAFRDDANGFAFDYYEQIGNFFNARVDSRYANEVICRTKSGDLYTVDRTLKQLVQDDPLLATYDTVLAPQLSSNVSMTVDQIYAWDRLITNVVPHGIKMCMAPIVSAFPGMHVTNYDSFEIGDFNDPFVRMGGGWQSHQSLNCLDYDAPSCYGRTVGSRVNAIKAAAIANDAVTLAAEVAAWDDENLNETRNVRNITDKIAPGRPVAPYIFGASDPADLAAGTEIDYGGTKAFFKTIALDKISKGMTLLPIYGGNLTKTIEAINELCDEQGWAR